MVKWIILIAIFFLFGYVVNCIIVFNTPYKCHMLFGKKGSGKTTHIVKMAHKYKKKGWTVFTTVPVPGCYGFDPMQIGHLMFPENSVLFIDEAGILFDNRNFKNFSADMTKFIKLHRHYKVAIYLYSQSYDIDKKWRDIMDYCYLCTNWFNVISVARKITRKITIVHADSGGTGESHLADDMDFTPWFTIPFGGAIFTWIPYWAKYFDSFDAPVLPLKDFIYYDERTDLNHVAILTRLSNFIKSCIPRSRNSKDGTLSFRKKGKKENPEPVDRGSKAS